MRDMTRVMSVARLMASIPLSLPVAACTPGCVPHPAGRTCCRRQTQVGAEGEAKIHRDLGETGHRSPGLGKEPGELGEGSCGCRQG